MPATALPALWDLGGVGERMSLTKGILLGTPNREPQEYSRNIMEYKDPGRYIPIIYLLYSWGSRLGVPNKVPLLITTLALGFRFQV